MTESAVIALVVEPPKIAGGDTAIWYWDKGGYMFRRDIVDNWNEPAQRRLTNSRTCRISVSTILDSSRNCARWPPRQAFVATFFFPSIDFGPVACSHGFHRLIDSACLALRSGVQVVAMICLQ